eukprot:g2960.t1
MKPVCLVIGAGAGIGGTVGTKFASEGYHAVLCRRSDKEGLDRLVDGIKSAGGQATGLLLNAIDDNSIEDAVTHVEQNIGPIEVVIYNLGAQIGDRALDDTSYKAFEMGWRLGTFGLFRLAKSVCPLMEERGSGKIIVTSATAAVRGNKGQHSHAAAMGGRRMLCQTLNAQYAPKGAGMQRLILMRHAKTEPWTEGIDDHARALTPLGHDASVAMAAALKAEGWSPDKAIVSTARRTRETWTHLSHVFGTCELVIEEDLYLAGERGVSDLIADHDSAKTLIVISHNPGLHDLSLGLLRAAGSFDHQAAVRIAAKLPTGAAVMFEAEEDGAFIPAHFRLRNFIKPKDVLDL